VVGEGRLGVLVHDAEAEAVRVGTKLTVSEGDPGGDDVLVGLPLRVRACEAEGVAVPEEAVGDGTEADVDADAVTVV